MRKFLCKKRPMLLPTLRPTQLGWQGEPCQFARK